MKKIFLMLAFTGLVASVSAKTADDKDKGKKDAKKETKSCCKEKGTGTDGKACAAGDKKEKSCCKDKTAAPKSTETK